MLRPEVYTRNDDPFACEILLTPGEGGAHFEALKLLGAQPRLSWFFGDRTHWLIHSQQHPLDAEQHAGFASLLGDAIRHDGMIRMTRRYDSQAALGDVVKRYELRASVQRGALPPPVAGTGKRVN